MMARRVVVVPGPAYRPPAYRPPPPKLGASELGQGEIKYNWGSLGQTILFGTLGAGALYGSGLLPDPVKTIAMVGGVGLIGYAAYSFLGSSSKSTDVPSGTPSQIPTPGEFSTITGKFSQPKNDDSLGFNWFSDKYDVKVLVSNSMPHPVTVTLELLATERPKLFYFIPLGSYENYLADSKTITIPGGQNIVVDFSPAIKMSRWLGGGGKLSMELTLMKIRVAGEATPLDHVSFTLIG